MWKFELLVYGGMFSGKTRAVVHMARYLSAVGESVLAFKHVWDIGRYEDQLRRPQAAEGMEGVNRVATDLTSYDNLTFPAWGVADLSVILNEETASAGWIIIDEAQFFDPGVLLTVIRELEDRRHQRVIVSQLDLDFRGLPFGAFLELKRRARRTQKMTAICARCGAIATRSQRLIDGLPAYKEDPIVLVARDDKYLASCAQCHKVPERGEDRLPWLPYGLS